MYDLADFALSMQAPERQAMTAQLLRRRANSSALQEAQQRAFSNRDMAVVAQLANNPELANAAKMLHETTVKQHAPVSLGQTGFALPSAGEFVESPMFTEEKDAAREATRENQRSRLQASIDAQRARRDADEQARAERAENARQLQQERLLSQSQLQQERLAAQAAQAAEGRALRMTLAEMRNADRDAAKEDKAAAKTEKDREAALQKYSASLEKAGVPEFHNALSQAESLLSKYAEGKLPGYGRVMGAIPTALLPTEHQMARTDLQAAANILLKARSGAAVTAPEEVRFLREVATGAGMDEKTLRHGWANLRKNFNARRSSIAAGFPDDLHEEFVKRGGVDHRADPDAKYFK